MSFSLQANWHDQSFYLWAREAAGHDAIDLAALRAAVGEVSSDALLVSTVPQGTLSLWIPSRDGVLDVSNSVEDSQSAATAIAPQRQLIRVPALVLGAVEAMDLLTSL